MSKPDLIQQARTANRFVLRAMREGLPRVAQLYREDRAAFIATARPL
jgi:hypothetical protein